MKNEEELFISVLIYNGRFTPLNISIRIADEFSSKLPVTV